MISPRSASSEEVSSSDTHSFSRLLLSGMVLIGLLGGSVAVVTQGDESGNHLNGLASAQALPRGAGQVISQEILDQRTATLLSASDRTTTAPNTVRLEVPETSQQVEITYLRLSDGLRMATNTENDFMPGLSLVKLFIADYVLEKGSSSARKKIVPMIRMSSDSLATELFEDYPKSISATAKKYGLSHTRSGKRWGSSETSTSDVVKFLRQVKENDPNSPILQAMKTASLIAEDGTEQNYGTSVLPRVKGTKFGWSDDKDLHSTVSFGDDFIVAAYTEGSASDLTELVQDTLGDFPVDGVLPQVKSVQKNLGPKVLAPRQGASGTFEEVDPETLISPEVNEAFKNYFRNNSSAIENLESAWEKAKTGHVLTAGDPDKAKNPDKSNSGEVIEDSTAESSPEVESSSSSAQASSTKPSPRTSPVGTESP